MGVTMEWKVKELHNVTRPGEPAALGDEVEIELFGGFVLEVDPLTRNTIDRHKRFRITRDTPETLEMEP